MTAKQMHRNRIPAPDISSPEFPVPIALFSSRRLLECNSLFAEQFLAVGEGEPAGLSLQGFLGEQNALFIKELVRLVSATEPARSALVREVALPAREGERRYILSVLPVVKEEKRVLRIVAQEVTAYAQRTRAAEEAEARYRIFIENSATALALVRDGIFTYVNKGLLELFGYMFREEMEGKEAAQFFPAKVRKLVAEHARAVQGSATIPVRFEATALRKDHQRVLLEIRTEPLTINDQPTLLWHCLDVSHWRDAEAAVEQKARENETLEHLLDAIHRSVDLAEVQRLTLAAALRWLGYECGGVFMPGPDGKSFLLETQERLPIALLGALHELPAGEGLMGYIAKTVEPVRVALEEYPAHLPFRPLFEAERIRALAFVPLVHQERLAGVLMLLTSKTQDAPAHHPAFLEVVSRHLGFSLEKAVVYAGIQRRADGYQNAIEKLASIVYVAAPSGTFLYCSPVAEIVTGYKVRELAATPDAWRAIVHPDDRSIAAGRISRQAGEECEFSLDYRILPKGKASYIRVRDSICYTRGADGAVQTIHGLITVMGEQPEIRRDAAALQEARQQLADEQQRSGQLHLLNEIGIGLNGALDRQSALELVHARLAPRMRIDAFGYDALASPPDILKRIFSTLGTLPADVNEPLSVSGGPLPGDHPFRPVLETAEPFVGATEAFGSVIAVMVTVQGRTDGILWVAREDDEAFTAADLRLAQSIASLLSTALERIGRGEEALTKARGMVMRNEELNHFAHVVAHDLKEPLIAVEGYTKLVLEDAGDGLDATSREHLQAVMRSSTRMKCLIDDLLLLASVGHTAGRESVVAVGPLLDGLSRDLEFFIQQRHARLELSPDLPAVRGDATELGIVFRNLIVNGIRYNRQAVPIVSVGAVCESGVATFSVTDNGVGIDPADAHRVFDLFQRLQSVDEQEGTGAGLAIVKKIIEANRGRLWLTSTPGAGSTFFFTVPLHG
jgi:PAS domain S-box-containing protein